MTNCNFFDLVICLLHWQTPCVLRGSVQTWLKINSHQTEDGWMIKSPDGLRSSELWACRVLQRTLTTWCPTWNVPLWCLQMTSCVELDGTWRANEEEGKTKILNQQIDLSYLIQMLTEVKARVMYSWVGAPSSWGWDTPCWWDEWRTLDW